MSGLPAAQEAPLWIPSPATIREANLTRFVQRFHQALGISAQVPYSKLHESSIREPGAFWRCVWDFCQITGDPGAIALVRGRGFLNGQWFPEARLNYAEALLKPARLSDDSAGDALALIGLDESGRRIALSRRTLAEQVAGVAGYFRSRGIQPGDRIAAVISNIPEAVVAMLAAAAVGAIWSSCSPDFGEDAICDRFGQIEPRILLTVGQTQYNHKPVACLQRVARILPHLPSVKTVITIRAENSAQVDFRDGVESILWETILTAQEPDWNWPRFPFHHPLCILYSSGTTGVPKCIVHGAGGTLLQHAKEHALHCDLKAGDRLFYYTTTGWMMWNWLVGALACDAVICLYDGSPLADGWDTLWKLAAEVQFTHFGASARYFAAIQKEGATPGKRYPLAQLRSVLSTGSPLLPESFDWIYREVKGDINLASISGGTDIVSCFVLGNPCLPVYRGQIQSKGLGMDVRIFNESGNAVIGQAGELVCTTPFPSMPVYFWNDPDGRRYHAAYFERFAGIWCHGDWALETEQGGFVIFGRSDATLNPGGVRIGTAEIYRQVETFAAIAESLATALRDDGDERIVLFVKMRPAEVFSSALADAIKLRLRERCSPRHVPWAVVAAPDLPRTISGKLSEIAVRNVLNGTDPGNQLALANPECLAFFRDWRQSLSQKPPSGTDSAPPIDSKENRTSNESDITAKETSHEFSRRISPS